MTYKLGGHEFSHGDRITWYTCGITPWAPSHLGHSRVFITCDIMKRVLRDFFRCDLISGTNITDIDDKIIAASKEKNITCHELSSHFYKMHEDQMSRLNVDTDDAVVRVTSVVDEIIDYVKTLVTNGSAFVSEDGVRMKEGSPGAFGRCGKSFSLLKRRDRDQVGWETPWGHCVPGWHVECSTITKRLFGDQVTFHAGGCDLAFPHHFNESVQNTAHFGQDSVRAWIHVGHLEIKGRKMSKSEKNFITMYEFIEDPDVLRMLFAMHPWQRNLTYSEDTVKEAKTIYQRFRSFLANIGDASSALSGSASIDGVNVDIADAFGDEMNTSRVVRILDDIMTLSRTKPDLRPWAQRLIRSTLVTMGFRLDNDAFLRSRISEVREDLRAIAKDTEQPARKELFRISDDLRTLIGTEDF